MSSNRRGQSGRVYCPPMQKDKFLRLYPKKALDGDEVCYGPPTFWRRPKPTPFNMVVLSNLPDDLKWEFDLISELTRCGTIYTLRIMFGTPYSGGSNKCVVFVTYGTREEMIRCRNKFTSYRMHRYTFNISSAFCEQHKRVAVLNVPKCSHLSLDSYFCSVIRNAIGTMEIYVNSGTNDTDDFIIEYPTVIMACEAINKLTKNQNQGGVMKNVLIGPTLPLPFYDMNSFYLYGIKKDNQRLEEYKREIFEIISPYTDVKIILGTRHDAVILEFISTHDAQCAYIKLYNSFKNNQHKNIYTPSWL